MSPQELVQAGLIEGCPDRPRIGRISGCAVVADDLNRKSLESLKAKGFTHFEPVPFSGQRLVYCFFLIPDLQTRLQQHVKEFFPQ